MLERSDTLEVATLEPLDIENVSLLSRQAPVAQSSIHRTRRVVEGVILLVGVAVIWVAASALVQYLNEDTPNLTFFLTYLCNSEFIILLPIRYARERASSSATTPARCRLLHAAAPTQWRKAAIAGAIICPLWFLAQGSYNWSLSGTSVSSSTILSTTSCAFTFILSIVFLKERFSWWKLLGVIITLGGAAMVSVNDAESDDSTNTWWGDALAIFSAFMYGIYTTAIRKYVPDDGTVSMATFFGFVGLFNAVALWPLMLILHFTHVEDLSSATLKFVGLSLVKGLFDNVLSDLMWARAIQLTSPTVATIALSLTIPIAMLSDLLLHQSVPSALLACGSVLVIAGFVLSTLSLNVTSREGGNVSSTHQPIPDEADDARNETDTSVAAAAGSA